MSKTRRNLIIVLACIFLFEGILAFLAFGKSTKVVISNYGQREISYWICKGELVGEGASFSVAADAGASMSDLLKSVDVQNKDLAYITDNFLGKGFSNYEVISAIKELCEAEGATVTVEDGGISFVGLIWIVHKFFQNNANEFLN